MECYLFNMLIEFVFLRGINLLIKCASIFSYDNRNLPLYHVDIKNIFKEVSDDVWSILDGSGTVLCMGVYFGNLFLLRLKHCGIHLFWRIIIV